MVSCLLNSPPLQIRSTSLVASKVTPDQWRTLGLPRRAHTDDPMLPWVSLGYRVLHEDRFMEK